MDKELKELKSVLRSLVVSSPAQVDVRSLTRDYRNMMGTSIPLSKYGYRDMTTFLKERCADSFLFQGPESNPVLTLIVPESLKHIDQFVRRQKPSAITKLKGKRRSVEMPSRSLEQPKYQPTNLITQTFKKNSYNSRPLVAEKPNNLSEINSKNNKEVRSNHQPSEVKSNWQPLEEKVNYTNISSEQSMRNSNMSFDNKYSSAKKQTYSAEPDHKQENNTNSHAPRENGATNCSVREFLKKRLPSDYSFTEDYHSGSFQNSEKCSEQGNMFYKDDDDSGRQTLSSQNSSKKVRLQELINEVFQLIKDHENGIMCSDILRLYRQRYSRELSLSRAGFSNINGLLCALGERVAFATEPGGVRVHDALVPPPAPARPRVAPRAAPALRAPAPPLDPDDALPGIDYEPGVFPADCVHYMESIPAQPLADVVPGAMLEVCVGEVYSPSHFWLQRLGPDHDQAMHRLMDEMGEYYSAGEGRARALAPGAVRAGHYCAALYERDWHRALIVRVLDADTVKVRHVDYGTVDAVRADSLKPLRREWAALPAQAVRARLAGLRPGAGARRWPHAAAAHFLALVQDKHFVANVVAVEPEEEIVETFLIDTSGADDVCVSAQLVAAGQADARHDSALRSGECYLQPRFEALESGATPNYGEIHRYLADGISLEYVDAYRRHVPSAAPPPAAPPAALPAAPPAAPPGASPGSPTPFAAPLELLNRVPLLRLESPPAPASIEGAWSAAASPPGEPLTEPGSSLNDAARGATPEPFGAGAEVTEPPRCVPEYVALGTPDGEVRLNLAENSMYALLSALDPAAAHCYMLSSLWRAAAGAAPPGIPEPPPQAARPARLALNPQAQEFRTELPTNPACGSPSPAFGPLVPAYGSYSPPAHASWLPAPKFGPPAPEFRPAGPACGPYGPAAPAYVPPSATDGPPAPAYAPYGPQAPAYAPYGPPAPAFVPPPSAFSRSPPTYFQPTRPRPR